MTCECGCLCCGTPDPEPVVLAPIEGPEEPGGWEAAMDRLMAKSFAAHSRAIDDMLDDLYVHADIPPALRPTTYAADVARLLTDGGWTAWQPRCDRPA